MNSPVRNNISDRAVTRHTPVRIDQVGTVIAVSRNSSDQDESAFELSL